LLQLSETFTVRFLIYFEVANDYKLILLSLGVYKPGNVRLHPELLAKHQAYVKEKSNSEEDKPVFLVFHGGSGSTKEEIATALNNGVVKMNVDTDTQWGRYFSSLIL
jgi:hypothetical protein